MVHFSKYVPKQATGYNKEVKMEITVIGVEPPCPRCERLHKLTQEAVNKLDKNIELKRISFNSEGAKRYGRVGTAHDIADWAGVQMDWSRIRNIVADGWSQELDNFLMPCKIKADEQGWLMTPVLVMDNEIVFSGFVPEPEAITSAINNKLNRER